MLRVRKLTFLNGYVTQESGRSRWRALEIDADSQGGASWALELGGELQVCPIVVEDLEYPGLMLIEVCTFFFIAHQVSLLIRASYTWL